MQDSPTSQFKLSSKIPNKEIIKHNKRAQRALGCSPEEKVKGNSGAQGHNLNNFGRGPFDDVIY